MSAFYAAQRIVSATRHRIWQETTRDDAERHVVFLRVAGILSWILFYFLAIWLLGFLLATPLLTFAYLKFAARESWQTALILCFVAFAVLYFLFDQTLHVPFPAGRAVIWFSK